MVNKKRSKRKGPRASEEFAAASNYLKGTDVEKPFQAVIKDLRKVDFEDESKWVLDLEDHKSIVLNKLNGHALGDALGDDMNTWSGQEIRVFTERRRNPRTGKSGPAIAIGPVDEEEDEDDLPMDDDDLE